MSNKSMFFTVVESMRTPENVVFVDAVKRGYVICENYNSDDDAGYDDAGYDDIGDGLIGKNPHYSRSDIQNKYNNTTFDNLDDQIDAEMALSDAEDQADNLTETNDRIRKIPAVVAEINDAINSLGDEDKELLPEDLAALREYMQYLTRGYKLMREYKLRGYDLDEFYECVDDFYNRYYPINEKINELADKVTTLRAEENAGRDRVTRARLAQLLKSVKDSYTISDTYAFPNGIYVEFYVDSMGNTVDLLKSQDGYVIYAISKIDGRMNTNYYVGDPDNGYRYRRVIDKAKSELKSRPKPEPHKPRVLKTVYNKTLGY